MRADLSGPKPPSRRPPPPVARRIAALAAVGAVAAGTLFATVMHNDVAPTPALPASRATRSPQPGPSPAIAPHDLQFVDIRTGQATPLPVGIRRIAGADHFQISPDGRTLAFDDGRNVYLADVDGTHVRRLTEGVTPWWSPDGTHLACLRDGGSLDALILVDATSGLAKLLVLSRGAIYHPNFGADGRTILFTRVPTGEPDSIGVYTVKASGNGPSISVPLPHSRHTYSVFATYSPDGRTIAFRKSQYQGTDPTEMTDGSVWLADADGDRARRLGREASWMSQVDPHSLWPVWSPDGRFIAYQRLYNSVVTVIDARTGRALKVRGGGVLGAAASPSWFDDHTLIVRRSEAA